MKYSRQREIIREAVEQSDRHPTADEVFQKVRQKEPTISLATVYRNLNQLVENDIIKRIAVPGDSDHFDHTMQYHEHMICTKCGGLVDIWPEHPLQEQFRSLTNGTCTGYKLILYGLCKDCERKAQQPE